MQNFIINIAILIILYLRLNLPYYPNTKDTIFNFHTNFEVDLRILIHFYKYSQINNYYYIKVHIKYIYLVMRQRDESDENKQQKDALLLREVKYRSAPKLAFMVLNICLSAFYFGYTITYLGTFSFENIIKIFGISMSKTTAEGLLNGMVPVGGGIGALTSFLLLKHFSRRNALLFVNCIAFAFGLLLFVRNQGTLFVARFFQGMCVGFYSAIAPLIIKQLSPNDLSGTFGSFNQLFVAFGVFFACLFQFILKKANGDQESYWFIMFGFTLITIVIQSLLLLLVYRFETPKYLLESNNEQQCRKLLAWIYHDEYVDQILLEKKTDLGLVTVTGNKQSVVSQNGKQISANSNAKKSSGLRLFVSVHLAILQQFIGINAVVIYGTAIANEILPDLANVIPVILNLEQTLACLVTSYLLMKLGRKQILQAGTFVGVISLVMIGIGFFIQDSSKSFSNVLILGGLFVFMANFGLSLGPIVWLYIPEILEPSRISISTMANWASASLITILFPIIKDALGTSAYLFLFYAVYCTVGFFINQKYVIETKGKTEKQIYNQYNAMVN